MTLSDYLTREQMRPSAFAEKIGVPASTISRILTGKRKPGLPLMRRIEKATGGAVAALADFEAAGAERGAL